MAFNPAPPERNRFQHYLVVKADNQAEIDEYLANLKNKIAEESVMTAAQIDEQPSSYVIKADFVVMPTNEYMDHVCSAFDSAVLAVARRRDPRYYSADKPGEVEKATSTLLHLATLPHLSTRAMEEIAEMIDQMELQVWSDTNSLDKAARAAIEDRLEAIKESAVHYQQAVVVCADAIRLLNITLADMQEDEEPEQEQEQTDA